jgi:hypothetical protein
MSGHAVHLSLPPPSTVYILCKMQQCSSLHSSICILTAVFQERSYAQSSKCQLDPSRRSEGVPVTSCPASFSLTARPPCSLDDQLQRHTGKRLEGRH